MKYILKVLNKKVRLKKRRIKNYESMLQSDRCHVRREAQLALDIHYEKLACLIHHIELFEEVIGEMA